MTQNDKIKTPFLFHIERKHIIAPRERHWRTLIDQLSTVAETTFEFSSSQLCGVKKTHQEDNELLFFRLGDEKIVKGFFALTFYWFSNMMRDSEWSIRREMKNLLYELHQNRQFISIICPLDFHSEKMSKKGERELLDGKQLIRKSALEKPSRVSFHSNIIIKTISLRKIISRTFFFGVCVYFLLLKPYLSTIIQFSFFFEVKFFFGPAWKRSERRRKKIFSARLKNDDTNLELCIELDWRLRALAERNECNKYFDTSALSDLVKILRFDTLWR